MLSSRYWILLIVLICCALHSNAQHTFTGDNLSKLQKLQDTLSTLSEEAHTSPEDEVRIAKNAAFVKKLVGALKITGSVNFKFDSLKRVSILPSADRSFRIITWFLPLTDGTYRYYGTIQMATSNGSLKLFPLQDGTEKISNPLSVNSSSTWLGARYYEIIPMIINGKAPYYILLGWKGNNNKTSKKVIEVLSFEKNEPVFGKAIFEMEKGKPLQNRAIFEYNKQNSMTLLWDKTSNQIVFDHLVPIDPNKVGDYEFYASDSSFDAFKMSYSKFSLVENVEMRNVAGSNEEQYKSPKKASQVLRNNF